MKKRITVGLFGKTHGLSRVLIKDLPGLGFAPYEINERSLLHPVGTAAVICMSAERKFQLLQQLISSLEENQIHLIFSSIAQERCFDLRMESIVRESGLPYTIVRVMNPVISPGHHHKLSWTQENAGEQIKNNEHAEPVSFEDYSQVLIHTVNRPQLLSRSFTVHASTGRSVHNWDHWFSDLIADTNIFTSSSDLSLPGSVQSV